MWDNSWIAGMKICICHLCGNISDAHKAVEVQKGKGNKYTAWFCENCIKLIKQALYKNNGGIYGK